MCSIDPGFGLTSMPACMRSRHRNTTRRQPKEAPNVDPRPARQHARRARQPAGRPAAARRHHTDSARAGRTRNAPRTARHARRTVERTDQRTQGEGPEVRGRVRPGQVRAPRREPPR
ncbi:hypothetical protein SGPA1_80139 [Streptomyces misionensis JCM 4497]